MVLEGYNQQKIGGERHSVANFRQLGRILMVLSLISNGPLTLILPDRVLLDPVFLDRDNNTFRKGASDCLSNGLSAKRVKKETFSRLV